MAENIVGKKYYLSAFSPIPTVLSKGFFLWLVKRDCVVKGSLAKKVLLQIPDKKIIKQKMYLFKLLTVPSKDSSLLSSLRKQGFLDAVLGYIFF